MLFNSYGFLVFFPFVCLIYFILPSKWQSYWLLISSYFFYMCWNVKYIALLFSTTLVTFICGQCVANRRTIKQKKCILCIGVLICLGTLFAFKYLNFAFSSVSYVLDKLGLTIENRSFNIVLPVGISFFTFQALSYLIDVYRNDVEVERNFFKYALFVSFFPQLVAGPIERSKNLLCQVHEGHKFDYNRMRDGLLLMMWGYFMKLVIADRVAIYVDEVYSNISQYEGWHIIIASIMFSIQIYCDFAGYSIIAIGAAKVLGFKLMENFNSPYLSRSVDEFWRHWHISLTSWFRDYLYIPLGGNRKGTIRKYINIMIVFLVSGLWHGAGWHYVIWGGLNGAYQVVGGIFRNKKKSACKLHCKTDKHKVLEIIQVLFTCILVTIAWVFFRSDSLSIAINVLKRATYCRENQMIFSGVIFNDIFSAKQWIVLATSIFILLVVDICKRKKISIISKITELSIGFRWGVYIISILYILVFGVWGPQFVESGFIYFQF